MVKTNSQEKIDHIFCILVSFLAINDHFRAGTFQVITELIFMFLESGEHEELAQLRVQFKINFLFFAPLPVLLPLSIDRVTIYIY